MSRPSPPDGTAVGEKSGRDSSTSNGNEPGPVVNQFYDRYRSFKANKAPAINIEEIKHVFEFFDTNHDGLISKEDLRAFMDRLGFITTEDEISSMVNSVDVNGDGSVDFNEFASLYQTFSNGDMSKEEEGGEDSRDDLKEAFLVFDKNEDGFISPSELQEVLVSLGINEGQSLTNCERMIQSVDADGNGAVDFVEFKKMMSADFGRG